MNCANFLKPPLKWAGGKRWLVPHLLPLWQPFRDCRLVEPFVGGMSVALGLRPHTALLNDINSHLINFYQWLQRGLLIKLPMDNDQELYYVHRQTFNQLVSKHYITNPKAAALFYYMNRTGFNGLCRFNRKGEFNVPFGSYKKINYMRDFTDYQKILHNWTFKQGDFADLVIQSNDIIYADPPYDVPFTTYSRQGFTWADQERLAEWLAQQSVPVILSSQATDRIIKLYQELGFTLRYLPAPRRISCTGNRTPVSELLATRNFPIKGDNSC